MLPGEKSITIVLQGSFTLYRWSRDNMTLFYESLIGVSMLLVSTDTCCYAHALQVAVSYVILWQCSTLRKMRIARNSFVGLSLNRRSSWTWKLVHAGHRRTVGSYFLMSTLRLRRPYLNLVYVDRSTALRQWTADEMSAIECNSQRSVGHVVWNE